MQAAVSVSVATRRNWEKLGTINLSEKLSKRANKTRSARQFVPLECLDKVSAHSVCEIINAAKMVEPSVEIIVFSLAHKLVSNLRNNVGKNWFFEEYRHIKYNKHVGSIVLPKEQDILGIVYQSLLTEGEKNTKGSYYTPSSIAVAMVKSFNFDDNQTFLDPACGSGTFLLSVNCKNPKQIYGIDLDPIAVMIARVNVLLKYDDVIFVPNIHTFDALEGITLFDHEDIKNVKSKKFDYIATNPPWGAVARSGITSKDLFSNELFSCFLHRSLQQLKPNGQLSYLLPTSFLNVKNHSLIRKFIVNNYSIEKITSFPGVFSNVTTGFVALDVKNAPPGSSYLFLDKNGNSQEVAYRNNANFVFEMAVPKDCEVLEKVKAMGAYTLADSIWGLGIVTGDNKSKLLDTLVESSEPIITGKEVAPFILKKPCKYIVYDRSNFQQVAPDKVYRADEKLVYKFISNKLVFAYDNRQLLCLNSANILIPKIPEMAVKSVMALLNSTLFRFVYAKQFGQLKVLKSNLCEMLFPKITKKQNAELANLAENANIAEIDSYVYHLYNITTKQQNHIKEAIADG